MSMSYLLYMYVLTRYPISTIINVLNLKGDSDHNKKALAERDRSDAFRQHVRYNKKVTIENRQPVISPFALMYSM